MFTDIFRPRRKRNGARLDIPDALGRLGGRAAPCELWTEYGTARIAEVKLQRPSPLATRVVQKAQT